MASPRTLPPLYRFSRPLIGAIALLGASLTGYLTYTKLSNQTVACGTEALTNATAPSCGDVLSSPYATVFGQPLSLFGMLAYLAMATFALSPLVLTGEGKAAIREKLEQWTWLFLLMGATAMTVFSGYLMYILFFKIGGLCLYCITSATFALSFFLLVLNGKDWDDLGEVLLTVLVVALVTWVGALGVYAKVGSPESNIVNLPTVEPTAPYGWEITTTSGPAEIALAKHLTAIGAKDYSLFTCPFCYAQRQLFGKEAFKEINYIECHPKGNNPQTALCETAGLQGFPTWDIKGQKYAGVQSLDKLAEVSGYTGDQNFKYQFQAR